MKDLTLPTPALPPLATEIFHAVDNAMYAAGISAVDRQFVFDSVNASASVRAALSHHEDGGRAATMVLVPREPTPEMIDALVHQKNLEGGDRWVCRNSSAVAIYKAAINAFNAKESSHE